MIKYSISQNPWKIKRRLSLQIRKKPRFSARLYPDFRSPGQQERKFPFNPLVRAALERLDEPT